MGKSTRLPAKSQGLGSGSGSIPMMRLWECGNLAFCSRFPHFHSPCSTATRFRHADRRRPPRLGEHRSGRPTGRPPCGTGSTGRTRPATRAGSTHPKAGRAGFRAAAASSRADRRSIPSPRRPADRHQFRGDVFVGGRGRAVERGANLAKRCALDSERGGPAWACRCLMPSIRHDPPGHG